jgi:hypothetical protein
MGTIIFLAILALAIAIPAIIFNVRKKQQEKLLRNRMNEIAQKNNCIISDYQQWKDLQIGLDQKTGRLFFIRNTKDHESINEVDLTQTQNAKVLKAERIVNNGSDKYTAIDRIDLTFTLRNSRSEIVLTFYNTGFDSPTVQGELQLAEKWSEIVNSWISQYNKSDKR